jgi:competence protein ComEC
VSLRRAGPTAPVVALCAGLAVANVARGGAVALVVCAALALLAAVAPAPARSCAVLAAVALAGWWWGSGRLDTLDRSVLRAELGHTARAEAVVTGPARRSEFAVRVPAVLRRFGSLSPDERVLLELPAGRAPAQGSVLALTARIVAPRGPDGDFDERGWLVRSGVHVVVHGSNWRVIGWRAGLGGLADRLRAHVSASLAAGGGGERRAVLAGVVLGEDEGLSDELQDRFRASGLYHLLAVSGQNVAFIAGGVLLLAWLCGIPRLLAHVGVLAAIGGYVLAVGWQPSVVRAGVAGCLASLAWLAARPSDRWHFLALGAAVLLAWSPANLLEPGFQLSFAAVAAIFVAVPRLDRRLEGYPVPRFLAGVVAVSLACGVVTAPILWLQFGAVPLYSVPANALAAPAMPPLLGLGLLAALVEPVLPGAAAALAWLAGWFAAYVALCARLVGGLPYAQVRSGIALAALASVALAVAWAARGPARRRRAFAALAAAAVAVLIGWRAWPEPAQPPPQGLRITFLDVGQGDAALLQVPEGAVLVDEGPPEARVDRQLRGLGVRALAAVVLTHPQRDHIGGAADVLSKLAVGSVLDPGLPVPSRDEAAALAAARRRGVRVVTARAGRAYRLGGLTLRILWPEGPGPPGEDPNQRAVVILASYGEVDALLTADAESDVTAPLVHASVEILKVAHHGSADPGLRGELRTLRPRVAVISVGARNDYGHPTASTIAALRSVPGLRLYRTDLDGRVVVETDGAAISVRSER